MVQALISIDFLQNFKKFDSFKISDFKNSAEIDIESFIFINQLLYTNKSEWYINLSEDKLVEYKYKELIDIPVDEHEKAIIIKGFRQNVIKSAYDLYYKIQREEYQSIEETVLPNYVFLGNVDAGICKRIEENLGVICLSSLHMKMEEPKRRVIFKNLSDTKSRLFDELNRLPYNNLLIEDKNFCANYRKGTAPYLENDRLITERLKKSLKKLTIKTNTDDLGLINIQCERLSRITNRSFTIEIIGPVRHDRYIVSNTAIISLGNGVLINSGCSYAQFPIGLYSDFFDR